MNVKNFSNGSGSEFPGLQARGSIPLEIRSLVNEACAKLDQLFNGHLNFVKELSIRHISSTDLIDKILTLFDDHCNNLATSIKKEQLRLVDFFQLLDQTIFSHMGVPSTFIKDISSAYLKPTYLLPPVNFTSLEEVPSMINQDPAKRKNKLKLNSSSFRQEDDLRPPLGQGTSLQPKISKQTKTTAFNTDQHSSNKLLDGWNQASHQDLGSREELETNIRKKESAPMVTNSHELGVGGNTLKNTLSTQSGLKMGGTQQKHKPLTEMIFDLDDSMEEESALDITCPPKLNEILDEQEEYDDQEEQLIRNQDQCKSEENLKLQVVNLEDYRLTDLQIYGVYNAVKMKKTVNLNGFTDINPRVISTVLAFIQKSKTLKIMELGITVAIFNFISFKAQTNFYFCEDKYIYLSPTNDQVSKSYSQQTLYRSQDRFRTWYTVNGRKYPTTGRGLCIGNNKLFFVHLNGSVVSLDLMPYSQAKIPNFQKEQAVMIHSGPVIDLSFTRKYLLLLGENGTLDKVFPSEKNAGVLIKKTREVQIDLFSMNFGFPKDTEFTTVASSIFEIIVTSFSASSSTVTIHRLTNELIPVDGVELTDQLTHVHSLKLLIRNKTSYYVAVSRVKFIHLLAVGPKGLALLQGNFTVTNGPLDGLCVINEDEILVFEGSKNLLKKITVG